MFCLFSKHAAIFEKFKIAADNRSSGIHALKRIHALKPAGAGTVLILWKTNHIASFCVGKAMFSSTIHIYWLSRATVSYVLRVKRKKKFSTFYCNGAISGCVAVRA